MESLIKTVIPMVNGAHQQHLMKTSFSKTTLLQREVFLTMFYTINLSPLLVTEKGFMLIIILRNYQ